MINGEGRSGTVRDGQGLWFHDDGLWVTLAKNGNGTVTVTGQNQNFYCNYYFLTFIKALKIINSSSLMA